MHCTVPRGGGQGCGGRRLRPLRGDTDAEIPAPCHGRPACEYSTTWTPTPRATEDEDDDLEVEVGIEAVILSSKEMNMSNFVDQVVIVTGGAKGIGRGICLAFAREGACVLCADVDEESGAQLAREAAGLAGEIRPHHADVSQSKECQKLVETAVSSWGGVDVLCNNVGIEPSSSYRPAHELTEELWDRILDVNLKSYFLMAKYCVPTMIKRGGGAIINTASVQGLQSAMAVSAYAASKGGILSLTRQLALEYAEHNIRVLAVNPGTIDTPLVDEAVATIGGDAQAIRRDMADRHPIGRIGRPEEIAQVVLFLASAKASFMTGENVCVDGGMMAKGAWA